MSSINIANSVSTMSVNQSGDSGTAKAETQAVEGTKAFSSLFQSLAGGERQEETSDQPLPKQLLEKIEDMLAALQEQPVEELSEEQQKLLYELAQLINMQQEPTSKEETILVDMTGKRKFIPKNPDSEKQVLSKEVQSMSKEFQTLSKEIQLVSKEVQSIPKEVQEKIVELMKKLSDFIPITSTPESKTEKKITNGNESITNLALSIMNGEEKEVVINTRKIEKIISKIIEFTEPTLHKGERNITNFVQLEQSAKFSRLIPIDPEHQVKVPGEPVAMSDGKQEAVKVQSIPTSAAVAKSGEQQQETLQQDTKQSPATTTASADVIKSTGGSAQASQPLQLRSEAPAMPTPVVRMNNLAEELGAVFKNSMRMNISAEGTQLKVNVTPDHLGHLDIRLTETSGKIAAQIFTSSLAAKEAIDLQLNQLRNTLMQQGVTVEKIEVIQQNSQQSLNQQNAQTEQRFTQQQQRQNNTGRESTGYQQTEEKSTGQRPRLDSGKMTVDYTV